MIAAIDAVRTKGNSVGGVVTCIVRNAPRVGTLCTFQIVYEVWLHELQQMIIETKIHRGLEHPFSINLKQNLQKLVCRYLQQRALSSEVASQVCKVKIYSSLAANNHTPWTRRYLSDWSWTQWWVLRWWKWKNPDKNKSVRWNSGWLCLVCV